MNKPADWDQVDQASLESFPASDPPSWGSSHAAACASTVCPPEMLAEAKRKRLLRRAGIAAGALGVLGSGAFVIRYLRNR